MGCLVARGCESARIAALVSDDKLGVGKEVHVGVGELLAVGGAGDDDLERDLREHVPREARVQVRAVQQHVLALGVHPALRHQL